MIKKEHEVHEVQLNHVLTLREIQSLIVLDDRFSLQYRATARSLRGALREFYLMIALWWHGWEVAPKFGLRVFEFTAIWKRELEHISFAQEIRIRVRLAWITFRYRWWERVKIQFRYRLWLGNLTALTIGALLMLLVVCLFDGGEGGKTGLLVIRFSR